jgi:hypothetical protein
MESDPAIGEDEESFSDIKGFLLRGSFLDAHGYARPLPPDRWPREIRIWFLGFGLWDLTQ